MTPLAVMSGRSSNGRAYELHNARGMKHPRYILELGVNLGDAIPLSRS